MRGQGFVIAIDGPVAAGKGTIARALAAHFGFAHLDTGALYRAVALRLLRAGAALDDEAAVAAEVAAIAPADLADPDLRREDVGMAASKIAPYPALRRALLDYQRRFAARPPGDVRGAVLEGRDITTVVCPGAELKIYVTATAEARAKRRHDELAGRGISADFTAVLADLRARDASDAGRANSPLRQAEDAHLLDTTNLAIDSAFQAAKTLVERALPVHGTN